MADSERLQESLQTLVTASRAFKESPTDDALQALENALQIVEKKVFPDGAGNECDNTSEEPPINEF